MNKYYVISNFDKAPKIMYGMMHGRWLTGIYVEHERRNKTVPIPMHRSRYVMNVLILAGPYDTYKEAFANSIIKQVNNSKYIGQ